MSSNKLMYDQSAFEVHVRQSTDPGRYRLYSGYGVNDKRCKIPTGPRANQNWNPAGVATHGLPRNEGKITELENVLSNRNTPHSKGVHNNVNTADLNQFKLTPVPVCENRALESDFTRLSLPTQHHRGMSINRFDFPHINPQANIFWDFSINSRQLAKDTYKARKLAPIDGSASLPKPKPAVEQTCRYTCQ